MLVISEMVSFVEKSSQPPVCTGDVECTCTDCIAGERKMFKLTIRSSPSWSASLFFLYVFPFNMQMC
jgi:hypothetical protein